MEMILHYLPHYAFACVIGTGLLLILFRINSRRNDDEQL